jgi:predicted permease
MWLDLKHAFRSLRRTPRFAATSILMMALGIAATTIIFSVVDSVLIRPLQFAHPDRIVSLQTNSASWKAPSPRVTGGDFIDIRSAGVFQDVSYYIGGEMGVQAGNDAAEFTGIYLVNSAFFRVLGSRIELGRPFEDKEQGTAVVSHAFAVRHFGGAGHAIGRALRLENKSYEIVGIWNGAPFPTGTGIWLSAPYVPENIDRTAYNYRAIALLKSGSSAATAQQQMHALSRQLAAAYPSENKDKTFQVVSLRDQIVGSIPATLYLILGAALLTLMISYANLSNLLLARGTMRKGELAIRTALGASRSRVARQLVLESVIISGAAGLLGTLLAIAGTPVVIRFAPAGFPRLADVHPSALLLGFSTVLSIVTATLSGLAPALFCSRTDLGTALNQARTRGAVGGPAHHFRNVLVIAEIALALVLTSAAGLLLRSFAALHSVQLGYKPEGVLVISAHTPAGTLDEHIRASRVITRRVLPELMALPHISSVAAVMGLPTGKYGSNGQYAVVGKHEFKPGATLPDAGFRLNSPNYFATMGIPVRKGRDFTPRDEFQAPFVAIISDSLARQIFPGEDPIGRQIVCGLDSPKPMTIVGIVGDVRQSSPASAPGPEIYMPLEQHPYLANEVQVIARTTGGSADAPRTIRQTIQKIDPEIATKLEKFDAMVADTISVPRSRTFLIGTFAVFAIALAAAGIYSVMNYIVALRIPEFGVRMAVGAAPADVMRLIFVRASVLIGSGVLAGVTLSLATGQILRSMLFGIEPQDPVTNAMVIAVIGLAAAVATFGPALRAARIDPIRAIAAT